jgi:HlyD family secretion protein
MRVIAVVLGLVAAAAVLMLPSWNRTSEEVFQGWVEAELIFVSPDEAGRIETLSVREGSVVDVKTPLFTLDDDLQKADRDQVAAQVTNARQQLERAQQLLKTAAGTQRTLDDAEMTLRTAQARLNSADTRLGRRRVFSPVAGTVQQVYFRQGEMVAAQRPVLAILPPANVKVRFFVSEAKLPQIAFGQRVKIRCDGCGEDLDARVSFISRSAEYTPPVIYSLDERAKLVFMIEARPDHGENFRVGQPVSVALSPPGGMEAKR